MTNDIVSKKCQIDIRMMLGMSLSCDKTWEGYFAVAYLLYILKTWPVFKVFLFLFFFALVSI